MGSSLASEVGVLARFLKTIAGSDRRTRDFTLTTLRRAIVEVVACLPVYRTYVSASGFSATDRQTIDLAIDRAQRRNPVIAHSAVSLPAQRAARGRTTSGTPASSRTDSSP